MLTPDEIKGRQFLVSLRGYDREEVQAFLRQVAEQVGELQHIVAQLRAEARIHAEVAPSSEQPAQPGTPLPAGNAEASQIFADIGKETQRILEAAQEAGARITRRAKQDADAQVQEARRRATKAIADSERRREQVDAAVTSLQQARERLGGELRQVGRMIEQTLRDLLPPEQAHSVREALASEAADAEADAQSRPGARDGGQADADEPSERPVRQPAATAVEPRSKPPESDPAGTPRGHPRKVARDDARFDDEPHVRVIPAAQADVARRAGRRTAAATGHEAPAVEGQDRDDTAAADAEQNQSPAGGRDAVDPHRRRAAALTPLHPKLVRRLRRGMADLHNIALDRLRRSGAGVDVEALLHRDEELADLWSLAAEYLEAAYRDGDAAAAERSGRPRTGGRAGPHLRTDFLADSAERITATLAATLRMGLSTDEDLTALADRIGSVFAELKSSTAEELAATHLIRAYETGMLDAWRDSGVSHRQWLAGREPRCPEGRCRHNDQAGAVKVSEPFPSGHETPPVHVGCTCTTVPTSET